MRILRKLFLVAFLFSLTLVSCSIEDSAEYEIEKTEPQSPGGSSGEVLPKPKK